MEVKKIMQSLEQKHPGEAEYLQAVQEVLESIEEVYNQHPEFEKASDCRKNGRTRTYIYIPCNMD